MAVSASTPTPVTGSGRSDAHAEQCDADAQDRARREFEAGLAAWILREKVDAMPSSNAKSMTGAP